MYAARWEADIQSPTQVTSRDSPVPSSCLIGPFHTPESIVYAASTSANLHGQACRLYVYFAASRWVYWPAHSHYRISFGYPWNGNIIPAIMIRLGLILCPLATLVLGQQCPDYASYSTDVHPPLSSGRYQLSYQRPDPACRKINVSDVEHAIQEMQSAVADPDLFRLFENSFPNTLDTTISWRGVAQEDSDEEVGRPSERCAGVAAGLLIGSSSRTHVDSHWEGNADPGPSSHLLRRETSSPCGFATVQISCGVIGPSSRRTRPATRWLRSFGAPSTYKRVTSPPAPTAMPSRPRWSLISRRKIIRPLTTTK